MASAQIQAANSLAHTVSIMDPAGDNKMFLEDNQNSFLPQVKFSFVPHADDTVSEPKSFKYMSCDYFDWQLIIII